MVNKDEQLTNESSTADNSPHWSKTTKVIVVIFVLLAIVWLMGRFKSLIGMLVIAAILSYLLEPIIGFIGRRTTIRRGLIIVFVYITLALVVIGGAVIPTALTPLLLAARRRRASPPRPPPGF